MAEMLDYADFVGIYMRTRNKIEVSFEELFVAENIICEKSGESGVQRLATEANYRFVPPRPATPDEYLNTLYDDVFQLAGDPSKPLEYATVRLVCGYDRLAQRTYISSLPLEAIIKLLPKIRQTIFKYSDVIDDEVIRFFFPQKKAGKAIARHRLGLGR
jgi:hypothetical protein